MSNRIVTFGNLSAFATELKAKYAKQSALEELQTQVEGLVSTGGQPNVIEAVKFNGVALTPDENKAVDIVVTHPEYSIVKAADSGDYAAVYNLTKDGSVVGASINIPKDMVVKSGSVVGNEIVLVLNDEAGTEIKIPVDSLIEYVTSGSAAGDMVVVTVSDDHKVTATITDGTITLAKLADEVKNAFDTKGAAAQALTDAKAYADGLASNYDAKGSAASALSDAKTYADGVAATAESNAKAYADGLAKNYDAKGSAASALSDAKAYADGLAGNYDAKGSAASALSDAKAYTDTQLEAYVKTADVGTIGEAEVKALLA